jgi:hypothetical protein
MSHHHACPNIEYHHLVQQPKQKEEPENYVANLLSRLAQGIKNCFKSTDTIFFIKRADIPIATPSPMVVALWLAFAPKRKSHYACK